VLTQSPQPHKLDAVFSRKRCAIQFVNNTQATQNFIRGWNQGFAHVNPRNDFPFQQHHVVTLIGQ